MPSPIRITRTVVAVAAASLLLGPLPASAAPAPEPADRTAPVAVCPTIDALAQPLRVAGFSARAAQNYAALIRRDCLDVPNPAISGGGGLYR